MIWELTSPHIIQIFFIISNIAPEVGYGHINRLSAVLLMSVAADRAEAVRDFSIKKEFNFF